MHSFLIKFEFRNYSYRSLILDIESQDKDRLSVLSHQSILSDIGQF